MTLKTDRPGKSLLTAALALPLSALFAGNAAAQPAPDDSNVPADSASASPPPAADNAGSDPDGSNNSVVKPKNYEFAFVSVGAYQTWAVAGHWLYLGAGGGVGPPLYRFSKLYGSSKVPSRDATWDTSIEVLYANAFARIKTRYVEVDLGPKIAITSELYQAKDPPQGGFSYGGVLDLRFGTDTIKIGPRFVFERVASYDDYANAWRITPLMLRVYH